MAAQGQWQIMGNEITDEILEAFAVIGTYDDVVDKIKERYDGIATQIGFSIPTRTPDDEERLKDMIRQLKEE